MHRDTIPHIRLVEEPGVAWDNFLNFNPLSPPQSLTQKPSKFFYFKIKIIIIKHKKISKLQIVPIPTKNNLKIVQFN